MKANISNMAEVAQDMFMHGRTEDEIAGILDIDVRHLERKER